MSALHALADPTRQRIVEMLAGGALSSGEIAGRFALSPPAISQHLKTLKTAKLVTVRTDRQKRIYSLDPEGVGEVSDWVARITAFWNPKLDALEAALKKGQIMKGELIPESAVRFVRDLDAPPDKIWAFLTDSARLPEWYGEGSIAPHEGGAVSLMGGHIRGVVTGWRPNQFLAYTWNVFSPGETVSRFPISYLEFTLDGSILTLIHRPIPQAMQNQTMMGWHTMLDLIEAGLAGEFPKRSDLFPKNAERYGVDINKLRSVGESRSDN